MYRCNKKSADTEKLVHKGISLRLENAFFSFKTKKVKYTGLVNWLSRLPVQEK